MKRHALHSILSVMVLIFSFQVLSSQTCTVDYIDPYSHEFSIDGGSIYVTVHTYPYNCGPDLDFPSWLYMYQVSEETYILECESNYDAGFSRYSDITIGNDYMSISQLGYPLAGGSIGGPNGESTLYIGNNTSPGTLTNQQSASGGDCSTYDYQWQVSTDGSSFSDISGATGSTYSPGNLTATRYYQRKVSCYGINAYSNTVSVIVSNINGGTISGDQTVCYNTDASLITSSSLATGGSGTFTYQWQKSENDGYTWANINGATSTTYDPPSLTITTMYHRVATASGGGSANSNSVTKTVYPVLFGGSIGPDQNICYNSIPAAITSVTPHSGGSGQYSFQWQSSVNNASSWGDITGASNVSFSPGLSIKTTYYRRRLTDSNGCGTVYSDTATVTVNALSYPDSSMNYIYVREPLVKTDSIGYLTDADSVRANVQYFDGLGRPVQNIQLLSSPDKNDIITPIFYDNFGRESVKYLPYEKQNNKGKYEADAIAGQKDFYNSSSFFPGDTANAKTIFDGSPLNRILEQGAPGKYWQPSNSSNADSGHTVKYEYLTNVSYEVLLWKVSGDNLCLLYTSPSPRDRQKSRMPSSA